METVNKNCSSGERNDNSGKIGLEFWQNRYATKSLGWHINEVNPLLVKYIHLLELQKPSTIFVPLCGTTLDIQWLYSRGHNIFAVDIVEEAVLEQFRLLNIPYNISQVSNDATIYESVDERVKILKCDFLTFDCSKYANTVDAVWDRGALIALEPEDQKQYVTVMKKLLKPKFTYLIQTLTYYESERKMPPFLITRERLEEYFEDIANGIRCFDEDTEEKIKNGMLATFDLFHFTNK